MLHFIPNSHLSLMQSRPEILFQILSSSVCSHGWIRGFKLFLEQFHSLVGSPEPSAFGVCFSGAYLWIAHLHLQAVESSRSHSASLLTLMVHRSHSSHVAFPRLMSNSSLSFSHLLVNVCLSAQARHSKKDLPVLY